MKINEMHFELPSNHTEWDMFCDQNNLSSPDLSSCSDSNFSKIDKYSLENHQYLTRKLYEIHTEIIIKNASNTTYSTSISIEMPNSDHVRAVFTLFQWNIIQNFT